MRRNKFIYITRVFGLDDDGHGATLIREELSFNRMQFVQLHRIWEREGGPNLYKRDYRVHCERLSIAANVWERVYVKSVAD